MRGMITAAGPSPVVFSVIAIVVAGAVLPLVLIPIVRLVGVSEVVEECAKAAVIYFAAVRAPIVRGRLWLGAVLGLLFGISESMLYLNQIVQLGAMSVFFERLMTAVPMHGITAWITAFGGVRFGAKGLAAGTVIAIGVHMAFNALVTTM